MAETDKRGKVNTASRPRAEPESVRHVETEAIETAMETGKDRRIRRKASEERAEAEAEERLSAESFEHDAREHSTRTESVREGRIDTESVTDTRTRSRSRRRMRMEQAEQEEVFQEGFSETGDEKAGPSERSSARAGDKGSRNVTGQTADDGTKRRKASSRLREGDGSSRDSKLVFVDEDGSIPGAGMAGSLRRRYTAAALNEGIHRKINDAEDEDENAGVEAAHRAEMIGEDITRRGSGRISRKLRDRSSAEVIEREKVKAGEALRESAKKGAASSAKQEAKQTGRLRKHFQKQRYRRQYAAAKYAEQKGEQVIVRNMRFTSKAAAVLKETAARKGRLALIIGILLLLFFLMMAAVTSCTASIHGMTTSFLATTYPSTDEDIHKVEDAYADMERRLNDQICRMESTHSGYDEYIYQVDEISHNPYHLISYFTTKYGQFTYEQVKDELKDIFEEQYGLRTKSETGIVTEKKKVRVGESLGKVTTSGYCACSICCGQWAGGATASGKMPKANHTIAVDAGSPIVPMGTHIVMNGTEYVVEDTGAFARYGVDFDVFYSSHSQALAHGHRQWDAYLADSNGDKEIEVKVTRRVNRLYVKMTNHDLDEVLRARMSKDEEKQYEVLNATYGNRDYLFDLDSLTTYSPRGGGQDYQVPPEALSDKRFARMLREARKYLGYPYVWGGSSPSTSFDCSGFVCWVINHCGNGWNIGRVDAGVLCRNVCTRVSPANAKPGDLIFFQHTYNTSGVSHVGIYVGNGMMIHCGDPIQFTSIKSAYWQQHFLCFGRIRN